MGVFNTEIGEKIIKQTVKTKSGANIALTVKYPVMANTREEGATVKRRCENLNGFFRKIADRYMEAALSSPPSCTSCELSYRVSVIDSKFTSIYFEAMRRAGRDITFFRPFSATFSPSECALLPIYYAYPSAEEKFRNAHSYFASRGIRLTKRDFMRNYYLTSGGCVVFAAHRPVVERPRRSSDFVVKYSL